MSMDTTILEIVDTRHRDEHGFVIPDSGDERECDACGHRHVIHCILSDGRIVGRTCAKRLGVTKFGCRYIVRHYESIIGLPKDRENHQNPDAGWVPSMLVWAARFPQGAIEVVDRVTGMYRVVVAGGQVNIDAPWQRRE
jgi:hypothetical protein